MNWHAQLADNDLTSLPSVYLVGIKGVGMAALAVLLKEAGVPQVSGADTPEEFVTDDLLKKYALPVTHFDQAKLPSGVGAVIYSGAHQGENNPLVIEAKSRSVPVFSLAQAVGLLSTCKETIAVCGVGGKSTTSALLSWIFEKAGQNPSFAVGVGDIPNFGTTARWVPQTKLFVIEADEYVADPQADKTPRFLYLRPSHAICTSLTFDHPDVYHSDSDTREAFRYFFQLLPDTAHLVIQGDDESLVRLAQESGKNLITVGESESLDIHLRNWSVQNGVGRVELISNRGLLGETPRVLEMQIPGRHNLRNAAYAAVLAYQFGVSWEVIAQAVKSFQGVQRRFEFKGKIANGVLGYDDYAHHPREIAAIAQTLKEWFPDQPVVVAFEPHTFSRTQVLWNEFIEAFQNFSPGTRILLLPIFASAREKEDPDTSSQDLVMALQAKGCAAEYIRDYQELLHYTQQLTPGTVFITMGAGTIYKVFDYANHHQA